MRSSFFTALAAALLASNSAAIHLFQRDASPAVVRLGTQRKAVQDPVKRDALRRRQTVTETLDNGVSSHSRMYAVRKNGSLRCWYRLSCARTGLEAQKGMLQDFPSMLVIQYSGGAYRHRFHFCQPHANLYLRTLLSNFVKLGNTLLCQRQPRDPVSKFKATYRYWE